METVTHKTRPCWGFVFVNEYVGAFPFVRSHNIAHIRKSLYRHLRQDSALDEVRVHKSHTNAVYFQDGLFGPNINGTRISGRISR